jgi:polysaccharide deacetylase 2 family uncharacterized protein YibQ
VKLVPGVSAVQANVDMTRTFLDLGARLVTGTESTDGSVEIRFAAGPELEMTVALVPPPAKGPDTVFSPGPGFPAVPVKVRLALVIEDMGSDLVQARRFATLPGTFTASVRPNVERPQRTTEAARRDGMEVLLSLPMEPRDYPTRNPGHGAILVDLSGREIRGRVNAALRRVGAVTGVLTYMGQLAVEDRDVMRPVLEEVHEAGLYFVDATQSPYSTVPDLAREIGVPFFVATSASEVDAGERSVARIRIRFDDFVEQAKRRGYGVGIVHPRDATLRVLEERLPELVREGIVVMPLTEVLKLHALQ